MSDSSEEQVAPRRSWWVLWVAGGFVAVIVVLVTVFSTRPAPPLPADGTAAESAPSKYEQTWSSPYSETTCAEWAGEMTRQQRFAAAADILAAAWARIEDSDRFPPDSLIQRFQAGVDSACDIDSATITDVTYLVYQADPTFQP
ncbi:hypothetical protein ACFZA2_01690 [Microbacterium sp. NPDC007973]|uniref:hypothetical protein n=1 Tax=Microbacterium sp. NPDC007973 TaxID=3364182 RepID=UPI0036EC5348